MSSRLFSPLSLGHGTRCGVLVQTKSKREGSVHDDGMTFSCQIAKSELHSSSRSFALIIT